MWPLLQQFSEQLQWPVNAEYTTLTKEEWKDILTAAFYGETVRLAQGLNGGVVMLGLHTRTFTKKKFCEFIDFIYSEAAHRNVQLTTPQEQVHAALENKSYATGK